MDNERITKAINLFNGGYNCSQAVFVAYADLFGLDLQQALKLSSPFGGGIAGMGEICGAVMAMIMITGLTNGVTAPNDMEGKVANYKIVELLTDEFKREYNSLLCKDLKDAASYSVVNGEEKPCTRYIRDCSMLIEKHLLQSERNR